jgi:hypothetical protein
MENKTRGVNGSADFFFQQKETRESDPALAKKKYYYYVVDHTNAPFSPK